MWHPNALYPHLISILQQPNEWDTLLILIFALLLIWGTVALIISFLLPKRYRLYRRQIFIFMTVMSFGLLFLGLLFALLMLIFGIGWATYRQSRPDYGVMDFEGYYAQLPLIDSRFHEGIIDISTHGHWKEVSTDEKIKSLKILYESKDRHNIGRIKKFLSDSSEETRLYAFSLISSYEEKLNSDLKKLTKHLYEAKDETEKDHYAYLVAETYWQFIFHGIADSQLTTFYTQKVEKKLQMSRPNSKVSMLLGKIYLYNREFATAKNHFKKAIEQGMPQQAANPFLAEIAYEMRAFNRIPDYMHRDEHGVNLKMKSICQMWSR